MAEQEYVFVVEDSVKEDRDIHVGPGGRHGHRGGTPDKISAGGTPYNNPPLVEDTDCHGAVTVSSLCHI